MTRTQARQDRLLDSLKDRIQELEDMVHDLETILLWNNSPTLASGRSVPAKSSLRALANEIRRGVAQEDPRGR